MFARTAPYLKLAHAKDVRRIDGAPRERHHHMGDPTLHGGIEYRRPASATGTTSSIYLCCNDIVPTSRSPSSTAKRPTWRAPRRSLTVVARRIKCDAAAACRYERFVAT